MKTLFVCLLLAWAVSAHAQDLCGFPGDTNNDGRADYLDLLPIGLVYGSMFEPRTGWTTNWDLQCFDSWPTNLPATTINTGFADTDGSGDIDSLDIDVIAFNYDSLHDEPATPPAQPYQPPPFPNLPCATIYYTFREDDVDPMRFYADVFFTAPPTFSGAMAAGIRFTYDPAFVIDDSTRVIFNPDDTDLMGIGAAFRSTTIQRQLPSGVVEMAVSGRAQNALILPRQIATIAFVITEDVIIRNDTMAFTLAFDHTLLINADGFAICHDTSGDTLRLILVGTANIADEWVRLFPNPTTGVLYLEAPFEMEGVSIYDVMGKKVLYLEGDNRSINVGFLNQGWHVVEVRGNGGFFRQKFYLQNGF